jgi:hypothetical protein
VLRNKSVRCRINELPTCVVLLRRGATYVTSAILPIRNVNLTLLPIARIVLILKAELLFADHTFYVSDRVISYFGRALLPYGLVGFAASREGHA